MLSSAARIAFVFLLISMTIVGCTGNALPTQLADSTSLPASTTTQVEHPTPPASPSPTPKPTSPLIYLPPDLPPEFQSQVNLPTSIEVADDPADANLVVDFKSKSPLSRWIYVAAAPFPTIQDGISLIALSDVWKNERVKPGQPAHLLVDTSTFAIFKTLWGPPSSRIHVLPADQILDQAWKNQTDWALLPFEQLEPRWKVIAVDEQNPLHKDFDPTNYPLRVDIGLQGNQAIVEEIEAEYGPQTSNPAFPPTNRRADRLTTVVVTGVTALVRGTAAYMEQFGMDYPARDILPWLKDADILHISNEIAFAKNCPSPDNWEGLAFCSQPRYIQLLDDIGTDVIDLAGDHFADWSPEAMLFTLDLYRQRGWPVYGGGENSQQAKKPALFEHNGNKIAFLGCNFKNPAYSTAGEKTPGAVHCDPAWLEPEIRQLKANGYMPIVTFQHEEYFEYIARPQLVTDFRAAAEAGAVIVSGSQAHQPQALEFDGQSLLHYGLGNLFFDQVYSMDATRNAFIDRHVFYNGKYINTELLTITFVDYALSRPMTAKERQDLLSTVFSASHWGVNSQVK